MPNSSSDPPNVSSLHAAIESAFEGQGSDPYLTVIAITDIRVDESLQARVTTDAQTVDNYADAYIEGTEFPPLILFWDGTYLWIGDGNHRLQGARKAGKATINCEVRRGSRQDALLHAAGANGEHGLPRTNEDKHKAVNIVLNEPEWRGWTDAKIAAHCHVSGRFVGMRRKERGEPPVTKRLSRGGRLMQTAKLGRTGAKSSKVEAPPQPTLNGSKSSADDNESAPPSKVLANTHIGARAPRGESASSQPELTDATAPTLNGSASSANDNGASTAHSAQTDAAVTPPPSVGDEGTDGVSITSGREPPTSILSSDENGYRVELDALYDVAVWRGEVADREAEVASREAKVTIREADVADREAKVKIREADVASRESEVELREAEVELREHEVDGRESEVEHREYEVD